MKILIAVLTCHRYRLRAQAQRETWAASIPACGFAGQDQAAVDLKFFLGGGSDYQAAADEVLLNVEDHYDALPQKSKAMKAWAAEQGYDFVFKCDDDTYVQPGRLLASDFHQHDYVGRLRGPSGSYPAPYASGFAYWLSARACRILANAPLNGDKAEDRWVGNTLHQHGIACHLDSRYVVAHSRRNAISFPEGPACGNEIIAASEYEPDAMRRLHAMWESGQPSSVARDQLPVDAPFSRVAVLIKTFLRDGMLLRTIANAQPALPGAKLVIVDDGYESKMKITLYAELRRRGHACVWLPFDSGFGAKANAGLAHLDREYTLIASDDFDFAGAGVADGVRRMFSVLDADPRVGSAAGRVDNHPYEGFIERGPGYFKEVRLRPESDPVLTTPDGVAYYLVDLTVNYNLVRSSLFTDGVRWETHNKIGGDHFDFYEEVRRKGYRIAWVPGVNINQQPYQQRLVYPDYPRYRARARAALPGFLRKHGITRYIGFDGREDRL